MIPRLMLREAVAVQPYLGDTAVGPEWGQSRILRARVEPRTRMVRDREGRETVSSATVFVPAGSNVNADDRLTWDGRTYRVLESRSHRMNGAEQYMEVLLR